MLVLFDHGTPRTLARFLMDHHSAPTGSVVSRVFRIKLLADMVNLGRSKLDRRLPVDRSNTLRRPPAGLIRTSSGDLVECLDKLQFRHMGYPRQAVAHGNDVLVIERVSGRVASGLCEICNARVGACEGFTYMPTLGELFPIFRIPPSDPGKLAP